MIRHRWCIERIVQYFQDQDITDTTVQVLMRKLQVFENFNLLFAGEGRSVIFAQYQLKNILIEINDGLTRQH